ncbi:electron transport complex subunit E [Celerinatantimonas diazotrophica]|uniref:Ion-translocating oxidoreductase complex subunit E n=1 Tax=Celerinatantimonas diazotrophica TaxID=412034 RepID=A0A4V2PNL2_9GAMM|nr:electron transport complex subunit E [Celerinatantimonas diazotrophica]TCK47511.1 electron transport complex protein RnfE [Celerinatantimonas diazotrophica]CAG9296871.1 Ion-translocating oxidoreductase complex subunit E [Celerinatantimonas diazotrophica]
MTEYREIAHQGLWKNNPALVQRLGLCPMLAVTSTVTNALGLGIATMVVLIASNTLISLIRRWVPNEIRIPVFVTIIASLVTCVQLLMNAYTYNLYLNLGIFIPLIVTNCIIIGRAESFAAKNSALASAFDGLMMGLGFTAILFILGGMREVIGNGTLFDGANLLLGNWASSLRIEVFHFHQHMLLAILPPGAFIGLGLLIALKYVIDQRLKAREQKRIAQQNSSVQSASEVSAS